MADTLLYRPTQASRITASFPARPTLVLENVAQAAGIFDPPGGTRPVAIGAIELVVDTVPECNGIKDIIRIHQHIESGTDAVAHILDLTVDHVNKIKRLKRLVKRRRGFPRHGDGATERVSPEAVLRAQRWRRSSS